MASTPSLQREARRLLEAEADEAYYHKIRELVPSERPIIGVRVPAIRALVKPFRQRYTEVDFSTLVALVDAQFASLCREEMLFGIFLLGTAKKQLSPALWPKIDAWIELVDNWEVCDQLAANVAAEVIAKEPALSRDLKRWAGAKSLWRRRFCLALAAALNQKGRSFGPETLAICQSLINDSEPLVTKALAWALREACKNDEPAVFAFLQKNQKHMSARVLRESMEKLTAAHARQLQISDNGGAKQTKRPN